MNAPAQEAPARQGIFIAIVGASGVGKDSLIRGLHAHLPANRFEFPQRIITRPPDSNEANTYLGPAEFDSALENGEFALAWMANGHGYALPKSVESALGQGRHIIANLSRKAIPALRELFPRVLVVHVTADRNIVEARLEARGRENVQERQERVLRGLMLDDKLDADIRIENNGTLAETVETLGAILSRLPPGQGNMR
jgi:ribose 1,5-bisphosphokinase